MTLDSKTPCGPLAESGIGTGSNRSWSIRRTGASTGDHRRHRSGRRVGGTSLGELGYSVKSFCIHDSPRRAHSIAAQGGINAAKNYQNDGDSI